MKSLTYPAISKDLSSRELIVDFLSREWPLSINELHKRVCKAKENSVTYQAVQKIVSQLAEERVLIKHGKTFQLNPDWLEKKKQHYALVYTNYAKKVGGYELVPSNAIETTIVFDDISRFCVETADVLAKGTFRGNGPNTGFGIISHVYWPLKFNFRDFEVFLRMTKNLDETYAIVRGNAPLDKWLKEQWHRSGFGHVKLGINADGIKEDILVHGDTVWEINYSKETKKLLDEIYNRTRDLTTLFQEYFIRPKKEKQQHIEVKLTRNPVFAELMRKKIMAHFEGEK